MKPVTPHPTKILPPPADEADEAVPECPAVVGTDERIGAGQRALARLAGTLGLEVGVLLDAIGPGSRPDGPGSEAGRLEPAFERALARIPDAEIAQVLRRRLMELGEWTRRNPGLGPV